MSDSETPKAAPAGVECVLPILRVRSLEASIDYYVRVLGFKVDWHEPREMASASRDRGAIMLCEGPQGNAGTWVWIGVTDAEALFHEYSSAGATIRLPPTNYRWAYEMQVEDPDGHVLRFGSEPRADLPFSDWIEPVRSAAPGVRALG